MYVSAPWRDDNGFFQILPRRSMVLGAFWSNWDDDDDDCSVMLSYGEQIIGNCAASRLSVAVCNPYLEQGEANVTFDLPEWKVREVAITPSPRQELRASGMGAYLIDWQDRVILDTTESSLVYDTARSDWTQRPLFETSDAWKAATSPVMPGYFTLDDMRGQDKESRARAAAKLEERCARHVARVVRAKLMTTEGFDPPRLLHAVLMDPRKQWLVQNEISARLLQGIFGATRASSHQGSVWGTKCG